MLYELANVLLTAIAAYIIGTEILQFLPRGTGRPTKVFNFSILVVAISAGAFSAPYIISWISEQMNFPLNESNAWLFIIVIGLCFWAWGSWRCILARKQK